MRADRGRRDRPYLRMHVQQVIDAAFDLHIPHERARRICRIDVQCALVKDAAGTDGQRIADIQLVRDARALMDR